MSPELHGLSTFETFFRTYHNRQVRDARQMLCDYEFEGDVGEEENEGELKAALNVADGEGEDTEGETAEYELKRKKRAA